MRFGEFLSEKLSKENEVVRKIASEVSIFGISDRQRLLLIYVLSLELEDTHQMREISNLVKELGACQNLFVSNIGEQDAQKES